MTVNRAEQYGSDPEALKPTLTADTLHGDEAVRVLDNYNGDRTWTEEDENRVRRKIDWRLLPVLCATYGLQYYDKAMLSQAVCGQTPSGVAYSN